MYVRNIIGEPPVGAPSSASAKLNTVPIGLMNGSTGRVVDIVYDSSSATLEILYIIVDFPGITLQEPFFHGRPSWVPIYPFDHNAEKGSRCQLGPHSLAVILFGVAFMRFAILKEVLLLLSSLSLFILLSLVMIYK